MIQLININTLSSLSYLCDECHKQAVTHIRESRRFESMYTLQGKTQPIRHVCFPLQSTHARRTLYAGSPNTWQPFTGSHEVETAPHTRKKSWQPKTDWPDRRLRWPHSSSHATGPGVEERGFGPMVTQLHQLTEPISPVCDRYVQYLLAGANWTVHNQHRRCYNFGGASLPHTHSPTFPTSCPHFLLMAPPGLQFNQVLTTKPKFWALKNLGPSRGLSTTRPSIVAYIYA
jgi:hypothetical protein